MRPRSSAVTSKEPDCGLNNDADNDGTNNGDERRDWRDDCRFCRATPVKVAATTLTATV